MCGYQRISPVYAPVKLKMRDTVTPFAFAEAVYGIGEWRGLSHYRLASADVALPHNGHWLLLFGNASC